MLEHAGWVAFFGSMRSRRPNWSYLYQPSEQTRQGRRLTVRRHFRLGARCPVRKRQTSPALGK